MTLSWVGCQQEGGGSLKMVSFRQPPPAVYSGLNADVYSRCRRRLGRTGTSSMIDLKTPTHLPLRRTLPGAAGRAPISFDWSPPRWNQY